jgi:hypothetical protein
VQGKVARDSAKRAREQFFAQEQADFLKAPLPVSVVRFFLLFHSSRYCIYMAGYFFHLIFARIRQSGSFFCCIWYNRFVTSAW